MKPEHEKPVDLKNPLRNLAGNPGYEGNPTNDEVLESLLSAMAEFKGACWAPIDVDGGYSLMLRQCPGACGHVWRLRIQDRNIANWLVNEINQRRWGGQKESE